MTYNEYIGWHAPPFLEFVFCLQFNLLNKFCENKLDKLCWSWVGFHVASCGHECHWLGLVISFPHLNCVFLSSALLAFWGSEQCLISFPRWCFASWASVHLLSSAQHRSFVSRLVCQHKQLSLTSFVSAAARTRNAGTLQEIPGDSGRLVDGAEKWPRNGISPWPEQYAAAED